MKNLAVSFLALLFALSAVALDRPDRWSGAADVLLDDGETYHCAMLSENLGPAAWQMTFVTDLLPDYQTEGRVVVLGHTGGRILVAVVGWGVMILTPADSTIRNYFTAGTGRVSADVQRFTIHRTGTGETQITIARIQ